jgi:hypothetical protein
VTGGKPKLQVEKIVPLAVFSLQIPHGLVWDFFSILEYSVLHPYLFLCLHCPTFCLFSLLITHNSNIHAPGGILTRNPSKLSATGIGRIEPETPR